MSASVDAIPATFPADQAIGIFLIGFGIKLTTN
jgi:hypothetical protein